METPIEWIVITGYAMIQNVAFFFIFLSHKGIARPINWILSFTSLCCGLILLEDFISITYGYESFPHLIFSTSPLWYLLGPLIYCYLRTQLKGKGLSTYDLIHLIPFIIVLTSTWNFYTFSGGMKLNYVTNFGDGAYIAPEHNMNFILFSIQVMLYTLLSFRLFISSEQAKENRSWQRVLLMGLVVITGLSMFAIFAVNAGNPYWVEINGRLFLLWLAGFIFCVFFRSIRNPEQLYFKRKGTKPNGAFESLSNTMDHISSFMDSQKPYRDPDYDIHQLACILGCSKNHLQQAIRQDTDLNFREYLNTFRIQEAKEKLVLPENRQFTIESIAEEVGFKSIATFYRVFKKQEGVTPTKFINK